MQQGQDSGTKHYLNVYRYPFIEDGITREDVFRLLEESGLGLPSYYSWRSRSGCYFCFFQQRNEWVGLLEQHPDRFEKAAEFEKVDEQTGERFTWVAGESLEELRNPDRIEQIRASRAKRELPGNASRRGSRNSLTELFAADGDGDDDQGGCLICHL